MINGFCVDVRAVKTGRSNLTRVRGGETNTTQKVKSRALVLTASVHQPPPLVPAAVLLADDRHQLAAAQAQVQVPAAHHRTAHLEDLLRAVLLGEESQPALGGRAQGLWGRPVERGSHVNNRR